MNRRRFLVYLAFLVIAGVVAVNRKPPQTEAQSIFSYDGPCPECERLHRSWKTK